jgi:hypothetical protein
MALNITTPFLVQEYPTNSDTVAGSITAEEWDALTVNISLSMDEAWGNYWIYFGNGTDLGLPCWRVRMQPNGSGGVKMTWSQLSVQYGSWTEETFVLATYALASEVSMTVERSGGNLTWTFNGDTPVVIAEVSPVPLGTGSIGFSNGGTANTFEVQSVEVVAGADVTVPVITLTGGALTVTQGDTYTDPGYSATDNVDGTITGSVVVAGDTVDTATLDDYTVTYNVTDAAGNAATQVTRVVTVAEPTFTIDSVPSVIRSGNNALVMQISNPATAPTTGNTTIRYNGASGPVLTVTQVQDLGAGVYGFIYSAGEYDSPPDLSYSGDGYTLHVTVDAQAVESGLVPFLPRTGYGYVTLAGVSSSDVTATPPLVATDQLDYELKTSPDNWDVSISDQGVITLSGGENTIENETFDVRAWAADDSTWGAFAIQSANVTATVDQTPPVISLIGGNESIGEGNTYADPGYTALDNIDGDVTADVVVSGDTVLNTVGIYTVLYDVDDAAGNSAVQVARVVTVTSTVTLEVPVIDPGGPLFLTVELGGTYSDPAWTASDSNGSVDVVWSGAFVYVNDPGVYFRVASATNAAGTSTLTLQIIVSDDAVIPTLTLLGGDTFSITKGSSFIEPGYIATDNVEGDITSDVIVSGDIVDTDVVGTYTLTYNVSDPSGNAAPTLTRTVFVTAIPVSVDGLTSVVALDASTGQGAYPISLLSGAKAQVYCYPNLHDRETVTLWRSGDGGNSYNIPVLMEGTSGNILLSTGSNTACIEGPGFFQIRKSDTGSATTIHVDT